MGYFLRSFEQYGIAAFALFIFNYCSTQKNTAGKALTKAEPRGKIVFMSTREGSFDIFIMDVQEKIPVNLTNNPKSDYWASYSEKNQKIYFGSKREGKDEIFEMDFKGENPKNLTQNPAVDQLPAVSPNGEKILFISDRDQKYGELYLMNKNGENPVRITHDSLAVDAASWSPDGQKIIFARDVKKPDDPDSTIESNFEIFEMNADGSSQRRITNLRGFQAGPVYAPNGKKIAFYGRTNNGLLDIFTMNADGSELENITADSSEDYSPAWSPDGQWLAYTSGNRSNYDIWIIHLESKEKRRLTDHPKRDETPFWIR